MHLCRVQIRNFRNFAALDVALDGNVVMIGENRIGKSNFIFALRLVLDSSLPDSARQLSISDIWDGHDFTMEPQVEVHLDFTNFDDDPNLLTLLTDYRLADDHNISRLSYIYRKKDDVTGLPLSEADFEFRVFGGGDETRSIRNEVRRRICLDVLYALRDAEGELATWRSSPLRPLIDEAISQVPDADLTAIADEMNAVTTRVTGLSPIAGVETRLRTDIAQLAGPKQDIRAKLGFTPSDPLRLFRSIRLLIDDGKRGIADASVGSANLVFLTLKLSEFAWRRQKNERNYTIVCIEEPEAHLHPHLQRSVFRKLFTEEVDEPRGLFLTTHSPNIASVAPLKSVVLLKTVEAEGTKAFSLARLALPANEIKDLQRYLDVTRAELLFSRAVLFVEGDSEEALIPVFARSSGVDFDELGISVCNVGGVNFSPYVKLATALDLPFAVITDWDSMEGGRPPLGRKRALDLIQDIQTVCGIDVFEPAERAALEANDEELRRVSATYGIFLNNNTLEIELARTSTLIMPLLSVLEAEEFGAIRRDRLERWKADPKTVDTEQLMSMVASIGKGRLAGRLAAQEIRLEAPEYIRTAISYVHSNA